MPYADDLRQFDEPQNPQSESGSYFPALAAISGRYQAPPPNAGLGAFMDDPFERAAYRVAGRQVGPPGRHTPAEMAEAASVLAPAPLRAVMSMPKVATAGLAAYNLLSGTDSAGGAPANNQPPGDPASIMKLQEELRPYGYTGPIDGIWKGGTQRAYEAKQQADQLKVQQDAAQTERDKAASLKIDAEARAKETERLRLEGETKAAQREAGNARLTEMENDLPVARRALRDYGPAIGMSAGAIGGALARKVVTSASNAFSKSAADKAEKLFETTTRGTPARVARVNEFWRKGGAGAEVPFTPTPGTAPGFAANEARSIDQLYQPSKVKNLLQDFGVAGAFGVESAGSAYMGSQAEERLARATEAASKDPSEVNIRELQAAKDKVAIFDAAMNFGRAGAIGYGGSAVKMRRSPSVPSGAGAEAERLALEAILRRKAPSQTPGLPARGPVPQVGIPPASAGPSAWMARQVQP